MRKRLGRFLPIVMLAILVQLFAPVAMMRVSAAAVADPLADAVICVNADGSQVNHQGSDNPHHRSTCCPLCALAHAVTPFDEPPSAHVAIQRAYQRVVWLEEQSAPATSVLRSPQQARAPPFHS